MKAFVIVFAILISSFNLKSQDSSSMVLSLESVLKLVKYYHPIIRQADILPEQAGALLLSARGGFDPKLSYEKNNKFFTGKNYYDISGWNLLVPVWPGVDFSLGTGYSSGVYLNPDELTPPGGLSGIGVNMPLLRNLITDQRRNLVRRAKVMAGQSEYQRTLLLNELCGEISTAYLDWMIAYRENMLFEGARQLSVQRLSAIRAEVAAGSKAAVDTLETWVQVQNFDISVRESEIRLIKSRLALSVHLWNGEGMPLEPSEAAIPDTTGFGFIDSLLGPCADSSVREFLVTAHPALGFNRADIDLASLDVKLKKQALLPELNLKYRMLGAGAITTPSNLSSNDYQFGVKLGSSLLLRKERGDYQAALLKKELTDLKLMQKQRELQNKNRALWVQQDQYSAIFRKYAGVADGYLRLYQTELTRLEAGESNMFLVNTREQRLIETRLKQIGYERKMWESKLLFLENAALLHQLIRI